MKFCEKKLLKADCDVLVNTVVRQSHVGFTHKLYNGRVLVELKATEEMVGHFFSEFFFTKRLGPSIHKQKINKSKRK